MEKRLEKALAEFAQAQEENRNAQEEYKARQNVTKAVIDAICNGNTGKSRIQAMKDNHAAIETASAAEAEAKQAANFATAVLLCAGQNVVNIAANIFLDAAEENEKLRNTPIHYKKWKAEAEKILPADLFFIQTKYNDWLDVSFRKAAYNHDSVWLCGLKDGKIEIKPERDKRKTETTLAEIKAEVTEGMKQAAELRQAVRALEAEYEAKRKAHNSYVKYLMPYIQTGSIHDNSDYI